jgi:hypothetical protein
MTWPSAFAEGTLGFLIDTIDDEMKRSGTMNTRIRKVIADAIKIYQPHRFHFSESRTVCTFNTVANQQDYTSSANAAIATLHFFDHVVITISGTTFELMRKQPIEHELGSTIKGQPSEFSYFNETLRLFPTPSGVYAMVVDGHMNIAAPASDTETGNRWMVDAERLIRSRAKYELSLNYGVDYPNTANNMHPETGATADAYSELKRRTNKLTGTGRITPTQF